MCLERGEEMFVAINEERQRVYASKYLERDREYLCPICDGRVRLRVGDINAPHFAHISSCTDDFTQDMSDWHREWQELFPHKNREVVISGNTEAHRADVLCFGTVIEFQHSPISAGEFHRRNEFYTTAGYKVVWIFDLIDVYSSKRLCCDEEWERGWDNGGKFRWKYPWQFLCDFLPQNEPNVDVFFQLLPFEGDPKDADSSYMERVAWVNPNYKTNWGRFHSSYKVTNFAELLNWLETRWRKNTQANTSTK